MIDRQIFEKAMAVIAERCAKPPSAMQLALYFDFLSPRLNDDEFKQAAMSVWSSAEFFPPPVAFMVARAEAEWERLVKVVELHTPPHVQPGFLEEFNALDDTTRRTLSKLGGLPVFKEKQMGRDPVKALALFRREYSLVLETEAGESARRDQLDDVQARRIGS